MHTLLEALANTAIPVVKCACDDFTQGVAVTGLCIEFFYCAKNVCVACIC